MGYNLITDTLLSFSSGLLTFVASCFFPIILIYFSFIVGQSLHKSNQSNENKRSFIPILLIIFGLMLMFMLNNFPSDFQHLIMHYYDILIRIASIIVVLFGLTYLGVGEIVLLKKQQSSLLPNSSTATAIKFLFFGLALGIAWLHCLTPILGLIVSMAYNYPALATRGFYLLVIDSFGISIPLAISGFLLYKFTSTSSWIKKYVEEVKTLNALFLTTMGVLIFVKPWWIFLTKKVISTTSFSLNNYLETKLLELLLK